MANEAQRLTEARVRNIKPPTSGRLFVRDVESPLVLQVTTAGTRTIYIQRRVNGQPVRVRLGGWPDLSVADARKRAQSEVGNIAAGHDPRQQRKQRRREADARGFTVGQCVQQYVDDAERGLGRRKPLKPSTVAGYRHTLEKTLAPFKKTSVREFTGAHIDRLRRANTSAVASAGIRLLRAAFNYAVNRDLIDRSPLAGKARLITTSSPRERFIPEADVGKFIVALEAMQLDDGKNIPIGEQVGADALLFMTFYGLRRNEAMTLTRKAVDIDALKFTIGDTKNDRPLVLPITPEARVLLERRIKFAKSIRSPHVFPTIGNRTSKVGYLREPRHAIRRLTKETKIEFSPHDLRRTFISLAARHLPYAMLKNVVNHAAKDKGDVTLTHYVRTTVDDLREPMGKLHAHLRELADGSRKGK